MLPFILSSNCLSQLLLITCSKVGVNKILSGTNKVQQGNPRSSENNDRNSSHDEGKVSSDTDEGESDADTTLNVYNQFKTYKNEAVSASEKEGFYIDGDLHEVLSLSDVLLLKENDYSNKQLEHFGGTAILEKIRNATVDQYVDSNVKFDTHIYHQISEVLRGHHSQQNPRIMKERINDIAKDADDDDDDYRLINIIINCINKIPQFTRLDEVIGKAELQGNYIDPIMYPMFHRPQANMYFRWLNRQVAYTETRRPDKMHQRKMHCSIGFIEVKPDKSENTKRHEDMVRLTAFCKDALELRNTNAMVAVQVIGFYISFYLFVGMDDGYYLMVELYSFETVKYLGQLSHLLSSFDHLKRIMVCSKEHTKLQETRIKKRNRSLDIPDLTRIINLKKPKSIALSLSFRK